MPVVARIGATAEEARAAGLPRIKVRDGDGKRMILVSREFMDELMSRPPRARASLRCFSEELLLRVVNGDEAKLAVLVKGLEAAPVILDMEKDILDQHKAVGYAYTDLWTTTRLN